MLILQKVLQPTCLLTKTVHVHVHVPLPLLVPLPLPLPLPLFVPVPASVYLRAMCLHETGVMEQNINKFARNNYCDVCGKSYTAGFLKLFINM